MKAISWWCWCWCCCYWCSHSFDRLFCSRFYAAVDRSLYVCRCFCICKTFQTFRSHLIIPCCFELCFLWLFNFITFFFHHICWLVSFHFSLIFLSLFLNRLASKSIRNDADIIGMLQRFLIEYLAIAVQMFCPTEIFAVFFSLSSSSPHFQHRCDWNHPILFCSGC